MLFDNQNLKITHWLSGGSLEKDGTCSQTKNATSHTPGIANRLPNGNRWLTCAIEWEGFELTTKIPQHCVLPIDGSADGAVGTFH